MVRCDASSAVYRSVVAVVAMLAAVPQAGTGQVCVDLDALHRFDGDSLVWTDVRAVSADDSLLVVLTDSDPVLHSFDLVGGTWRGSWGSQGDGPGEFRSSTGVVLADHYIYALDGTQARLSVFDFAGELVRTVALNEFGIPRDFSKRLKRAGGNKLLFLVTEPMGDESVVIARSFGASASEDPVGQDTVTTYQRATELLRLTAPGSPSWTTPPPYLALPRWTPVSGSVAFWQGPGLEITVLGLDGTVQSAYSLPLGDRFEVSAEDRESWFNTAIPTEFMGQRVFEPVREAARETVEFPEHHPLVLDLLGGPDGSLWVRRTPSRRGQVWDVVDERGSFVGRVSLASGHRLMSVLAEHVVLRATDDLGVQSVQVHGYGSGPLCSPGG